MPEEKIGQAIPDSAETEPRPLTGITLHQAAAIMTFNKEEAERQYQRAEEYRVALQSIANNSCCSGCGEAAKVAQSALVGSAPDAHSGARTIMSETRENWARTLDYLARVLIPQAQRDALRAGAAALRDTNEEEAFKRLSMALTKGNAGTWDELFDAAEKVGYHGTQPLSEAGTSTQSASAKKETLDPPDHAETEPRPGNWLALMQEADRVTIATVARYGGNASFREMEVGRAVAHAVWMPKVGRAPDASSREWRPIATLPFMDATPFLAWSANDGTVYTLKRRDGRYWVAGTDQLLYASTDRRLSHWMPLPAPPVETPP